MKSISQFHFELFRYQLLPTSKTIQLNLLAQEVTDYDSLVAEKNNIFSTILQNERIRLNENKSQLVFRLEYFADEYFIFRIGVRRSLIRNTEDFKTEEIENYPNILIAINNSRTEQTIAIQRNYKAFAHTETVSHLLENSFENYLQKYQLAIYIEPIYSEAVFWDMVKKYSERIHTVSFELIRPNLSNISGKIEAQLKQLQSDTNAHKTKIELESSKDSTLVITEDNEQIDNLVNYASQGGGAIALKVRGISRILKTNKSTRTITISEIDYNGSKENLIEIFKDLGL
jgi:Holliday junction resolvase